MLISFPDPPPTIASHDERAVPQRHKAQPEAASEPSDPRRRDQDPMGRSAHPRPPRRRAEQLLLLEVLGSVRARMRTLLRVRAGHRADPLALEEHAGKARAYENAHHGHQSGDAIPCGRQGSSLEHAIEPSGRCGRLRLWSVSRCGEGWLITIRGKSALFRRRDRNIILRGPVARWRLIRTIIRRLLLRRHKRWVPHLPHAHDVAYREQVGEVRARKVTPVHILSFVRCLSLPHGIGVLLYVRAHIACRHPEERTTAPLGIRAPDALPDLVGGEWRR